jgi:threonine dehydrogenase-like Zn-dependent dehydrogenase
LSSAQAESHRSAGTGAAASTSAAAGLDAGTGAGNDAGPAAGLDPRAAAGTDAGVDDRSSWGSSEDGATGLGPSLGGTTTDALLLDEHLTIALGTRQLPPPGPGEALVRVAWAGVCGSDLHVLRTGEWVAYWPATLGHEVVGVVAECPGAEIASGTPVVVDSRLPCRKCPGCRKAPSLCHNMSWLGEALPGGFARHLVVPVTSLVPCPGHLEPAVAVLAEPLAVAMHAVSRLAQRPDDVLLLGYGPVGALVHLELVRRWPGLRVSVSEPSEGRRQLAVALGAGLAASASDNDSDNDSDSASDSDRDGSGLFSLVVDAAGYPQSLADACTRAHNGGTVLLVALSFDAVNVVPAQLVERSLTIVGSVGFDDELEKALLVLAADPDRYRPLVTEAVLLEEAAERLAALASAPSPGDQSPGNRPAGNPPAGNPPAGKIVVRPWLQ